MKKNKRHPHYRLSTLGLSRALLVTVSLAFAIALATLVMLIV